MTLSGVENTDKFFHLVSQPQASYEALDAGQGGDNELNVDIWWILKIKSMADHRLIS